MKTTSLLVLLSGIIAAGSLLVSGVGQMAFAADQTSAGTAATGTGSSSTGTGAASLSVTVPLLGPITASGSGGSSTGSATNSHSGGGIVASCALTIPPITVGGGCSSSTP
jgi:hypothetical protein